MYECSTYSNDCSTVRNVHFLVYECMIAMTGYLWFQTPIAVFVQYAIYAYFKHNSKNYGASSNPLHSIVQYVHIEKTVYKKF